MGAGQRAETGMCPDEKLTLVREHDDIADFLLMNNSKSAIGERLRWVDCCRGICIILVVYGHVTGGLVASGVVHGGSAFDQFRNWVYLFHMPAFFFLSGLFAAKALERPLWAVAKQSEDPGLSIYFVDSHLCVGSDGNGALCQQPAGYKQGLETSVGALRIRALVSV